MAALRRPLSIGTEADPLSSSSCADFADYSLETCRKYAKLPSSSARQTSRGPPSPRNKQSDPKDQEPKWSGWSAHASRMFSSSLIHHDGGAPYTTSTSAATAHRSCSQDRAAAAAVAQWRGNAYQAGPDYAETYTIPQPPSPPPAPPLPVLSGSAARRGSFSFPPTGLAAQTLTDVAPKRTTPIWEWCANMVCYIWFAGVTPEHSPIPTPAIAATPCRSPTTATAFHAPLQSSPLANRRHRKSDSLGSLSECSKFSAHDLSQAVEAHLRASADPPRSPSSVATDRKRDPLSLRLSAQHRFKLFVKDLLNTTQVSKSVILLALLYIHRLKSRHPGLRGEEGSEFRLFITALMLGNKFLDDHTYTNKTWSELSGIELKDITRMEVEFWLGLSMSIYVSDVDFRHWIRTLEQLAQRRQQALVRREQEVARKTAVRQQQRLHRQQQQILSQQSARRQLQYSRASPSLPWSPQAAYRSDGTGLSPYRSAATSMSHMMDEAVRRPPSATSAATATHSYVSLPEADGLGAQPVGHDCRRLSPPDVNAHLSNRRASSVGLYEAAVPATMKRPLAALHGCTSYQSQSSPSPERPRKRVAGLEAAYYEDRLQRPSVSPGGHEVAHRHQSEQQQQQQQRDSVSRQVAPCISPISNQPYPRSVFEPLVTTPNTLLAPYVSHQTAAQAEQHRHHPLAYWQLAAGHDRGILGVHLPAPLPSSNEYYPPAAIATAESTSRPGSSSCGNGVSPAALRLPARRPIAATTPYPTSYPVQFHHEQHGPVSSGAGYVAHLVPIPDAVDIDEAQRAASSTHVLVSVGSAPIGGHFEGQPGGAPHHYLYQSHHPHHPQYVQQHHPHPQHAPHAPFNNAEGSYVDPFARFL